MMGILTPETYETLRQARRQLDQVEGVREIGEPEGFDWAKRFGIRVVIGTDTPSEYIPAESAWYLVADENYPYGQIEVYPAKKGGVVATFPHQDLNLEGDKRFPWRSGDICVRRPEAFLGRSLETYDPIGSPNRLAWYVQQAIAWIKAASTDTLLRLGDPYELPHFKPNMGCELAFIEDAKSHASWSKARDRYGLCELKASRSGKVLHLIRFITPNGQELQVPAWGEYAKHLAKPETSAAWIRLSQPPTIPPYQTPQTWQELLELIAADGIDFEQIFRLVGDTLRKQKRPLLIVGFPIPEYVGKPTVRHHWQPIMLPKLSTKEKPRKGFSGSSKGLNRADLMKLSGTKAIQWQEAANWNQADRSRRGALPGRVAAQRIALIGCGSLGSIIGLGLAKSGIHRLTVIDSDVLEVGNLVRHSLDAASVGESKAEAMLKQLAAANPNADISTARAIINTADLTRLENCDAILDCTGSDDLLYLLSQREWEQPKYFISLSVGFAARRLYIFASRSTSFPLRSFQEQMEPWLHREREDTVLDDFPWEGIGCWHPVFPARYDDMAIMGISAIKHIDGMLDSEDTGPNLTVYTQKLSSDGSFEGLGIVESPDDLP